MSAIRYKVDFGGKPVRKPRGGARLPHGASGEPPAATGEGAAKAPPQGPPSRQARLLALAYKVERMIDSGELRDYAEAARRLGVSRARMSQVMGMLNLLPELQAALILCPMQGCRGGRANAVSHGAACLSPRTSGVKTRGHCGSNPLKLGQDARPHVR